ncbi:hypothetical protein BH10ACT10_BH10ACT10_23610 [soil metagenome]
MSSEHPSDTSTDLDPRFVFDFRIAEDPGDGRRFSPWLSV